MKKSLPKASILWLICLICVKNSFGQSTQNDSTYSQNVIAQTTATYNKAIGQQSRLFSGSEYLPYERSLKGNALYPLDAKSWESGSVTYDGITYNNIPMMYDIYRAMVVVLL